MLCRTNSTNFWILTFNNIIFSECKNCNFWRLYCIDRVNQNITTSFPGEKSLGTRLRTQIYSRFYLTEKTDTRSTDPRTTLRTGTWTTPANPLYGPPLPKNRIKIINKELTYGLSNRFLMSVKFWTLRCSNIKDLGSGSGASYIKRI